MKILVCNESIFFLVFLNELCGFVLEIGWCKVFKFMYYFDVSVDMCKLFNYGGCGGNVNKFEIKGLCEYVCKEYSRLNYFFFFCGIV